MQATIGNLTSLYIADSPGKGRGVFAAQNFAPGDLIEYAPVLVVPAGQWEYMDKTILFDYYFAWREHSAVALGYGSLYNHSFQPNARYIRHFEQELIEFRALREITPDEEILVNYNGDPTDDSPLWFRTIP